MKTFLRFTLRDLKLVSMYNICDDLGRLKSRDQAPLLLPPKDYDTVHRKQGNLIKTGNMKCLNKEIVGKSGVYKIVDDDAEEKQNGESNAGDDVTMVLGQTNSPVRSSVNSEYEQASHDEQVVYSSAEAGARKPFVAGPHTRELQQQSYFPSHSELPNYLQSSRSSLNSSSDERDLRNNFRGANVKRSGSGAHSGMRFLRKQQSSPEFSQLPGYKLNKRSSADVIVPESFPEMPLREREAYLEPPVDYTAPQKRHPAKLKRVVSGYY